MKLKKKKSFSKRFFLKPNKFFKRISSYKNHNLYSKSSYKKNYLSKRKFLSKSDSSIFNKFY